MNPLSEEIEYLTIDDVKKAGYLRKYPDVPGQFLIELVTGKQNAPAMIMFADLHQPPRLAFYKLQLTERSNQFLGYLIKMFMEKNGYKVWRRRTYTDPYSGIKYSGNAYVKEDEDENRSVRGCDSCRKSHDI